MAKRNKIEVDVVAELKKLQKQFGDFKNKVERDGIDAPVQGDFAQFEADWKTEKNKIESDPIYAEVKINARKLEDQVNDLKAKVTKTPIEFKTTLDKRLLGGIEDKLNRIGVRVKGLQDSIARSDEIELIKEDQIKKIDKAKISLTEAFLELDRINKGNVRTGSKDSLMFNFDSDRLKKQAEQFQKQGASILESANIDLFTKLSTGSSSFGALFQEVLTYVAKTGDLTHQLTEEGLTVRDVFTTVLDSVRKVAERENLSVEKFINGFANTGRINADIIKSVSTLLSSEEKLVSIEDQLGKAQERELFKKNQADQVDNIVKALERLSTVLDEINSKAGNTVLNFDLGQSAGDEAVAAKWTSEAQRRMKIYDKMFDELGGEQGMQNIYAKMYSSMGGDIEDYMGMFSRSALQKLDSKELTKRLSQFFGNIKRLVKEVGEDTDDLDKYLSSFVKGIPDTNFKAIENRVGKTRAANATDLIKESLGGSETSAEDLKEALKGVEEILEKISQTLTEIVSKMESLNVSIPESEINKIEEAIKDTSVAKDKLSESSKENTSATDKETQAIKEETEALIEQAQVSEEVKKKNQDLLDEKMKGTKVISQRGVTSDDRYSYLQQLDNGQQLSTRVSYDKNGNIQFAEQEILAYKQIENEIIKLEKEVFKYENIKKEVLAKGGSTVETDNLIAFQQKEIERLEKILKDMESGPNSANYVYGSNEANLFSQRRQEAKRIRELRQLSREEQKIQKPKPVPNNPNARPIDNRDLVAIQRYRNEIEKLENTLKQYNGLGEVLTSGVNAGQTVGNVLKKYREDIDKNFIKTKGDLDALKNGFDLANKEMSNFISNGKNLDSVDKELKEVVDKIEALSNGKTQGFQNKIENELGSIRGFDKTNTSLDDLSEKLNKAREAYARLAKEGKDASNILADSGSISKWTAKIDKFIGDNSALGSGQKEQLIRLKMKLDGAEVTAQQLKEIKNEFFEIQSAAYGAGQTGTSAIENLRNRIKQMSTNFIAMYFSFYDIARYTKEVMESVKEFDTALTEMRKVSDESINTLKNFQTESFGTADAIGATSLALQKSTADWLRLGRAKAFAPLYSNVY